MSADFDAIYPSNTSSPSDNDPNKYTPFPYGKGVKMPKSEAVKYLKWLINKYAYRIFFNTENLQLLMFARSSHETLSHHLIKKYCWIFGEPVAADNRTTFMSDIDEYSSGLLTNMIKRFDTLEAPSEAEILEDDVIMESLEETIPKLLKELYEFSEKLNNRKEEEASPKYTDTLQSIFGDQVDMMKDFFNAFFIDLDKAKNNLSKETQQEDSDAQELKEAMQNITGLVSIDKMLEERPLDTVNDDRPSQVELNYDQPIPMQVSLTQARKYLIHLFVKYKSRICPGQTEKQLMEELNDLGGLSKALEDLINTRYKWIFNGPVGLKAYNQLIEDIPTFNSDEIKKALLHFTSRTEESVGIGFSIWDDEDFDTRYPKVSPITEHAYVDPVVKNEETNKEGNENIKDPYFEEFFPYDWDESMW